MSACEDRRYKRFWNAFCEGWMFGFGAWLQCQAAPTQRWWWYAADAQRIGCCRLPPPDPRTARHAERKQARRGLPICHEHEDCRRSLALGVACALGAP